MDPGPTATTTEYKGTTYAAIRDGAYFSPEDPHDPWYIGRILSISTHDQWSSHGQSLALGSSSPRHASVQVSWFHRPKDRCLPLGLSSPSSGLVSSGVIPAASGITPPPPPPPGLHPSLKHHHPSHHGDATRSSGRKGQRGRPSSSDHQKSTLKASSSLHPLPPPSSMLIASMSSDTVPLSSIRGKCLLAHLSTHPSHLKTTAPPTATTTLQDEWWYNQCYDKYTRALFDVLPISAITNLAPSILQALSLQRYQYILVEQGTMPLYTCPWKECPRCQQHIPPAQEGIQCTKCSSSYHLSCMDMKRGIPAKGYAWYCPSCATSLRKGRASSDAGSSLNGDANNTGNDNGNPSIQHSRQGKEEQVSTNQDQLLLARIKEREYPPPLWPFRYFGKLSRLEDLADPDDKGYPKAASRIGPNYQAVVPDLTFSSEGSASTSLLSSPAPSPAPSRPVSPSSILPSSIGTLTRESVPGRVGRPRKIPSLRRRNHRPSAISEKEPTRLDELVFSGYEYDHHTHTSETDLELYLTQVASHCRPAADRGEWVDVALFMLQHYGYDTAKALAEFSSAMSTKSDHVSISTSSVNDSLEPLSVRTMPLPFPTWTPEEEQRFEEAVESHGFQITHIARLIGKPRAQVVLFFYKWKKSPRYAIVYGKYCAKYRPSKTFVSPKITQEMDVDTRGVDGRTLMDDDDAGDNNDGADDDDDDSVSESNIDSNVETSPSCSNCLTTTASRYKRVALAPSLVSDVYCLECVVYWRKRATLPIHESSLAASGSKKRKVKGEGGGKAIPLQIAPKLMLGAYEIKEEWMPQGVVNGCAVCKASPAPSDDEGLLVCGQCGMQTHAGCYGIMDPIATCKDTFTCDRCLNHASPEASIHYNCIFCPRPNATVACAMKKTIGLNWAHVACALWIPELKFSPGCEYIECIGAIPITRWQASCSVCSNSEGVCVTCHADDCGQTFHVSCAQRPTNEYTVWVDVDPISSALLPVAYCSKHAKRALMAKNDVEGSTLAHARHDLPLHLKIKALLPHEKLSPEKLDATICHRRAMSFGLGDSCDCHEQQGDVAAVLKPIQQELLPTLETPTECVTCHTHASPVWWPAMLGGHIDAKVTINVDAMGRVVNPPAPTWCHSCAMRQLVPA